MSREERKMMQQKYSVISKNGHTYYVGYHYDIFGQRHQVTATSVAELEDKLYHKRMETEQRVCLSSKPFGEYLLSYLQEVHYKNIKKASQTRYDSIFRTHILGSEISKIPLKNLTVDQVQTFMNNLYFRKSRSVCEQVRKILSPCLRYAYGKGDILRDFTRQIIIPRDCDSLGVADNVHPLTLDEQMTFVDFIDGNPYETLFRTALDGGYRKGELLALTWKDIDFERQTIHITKTYGYGPDPVTGKCSGYTTPPKTRNARRKNKTPRVLLNLLFQHKKQQKIELNQAGIRQTEDTLVFCTPIGTHLDPSNVNKELKKIFADLGIDSKKHFHDLRHTYATRQFELGTEVLIVSRMLGHSDVNVTLKTYTHVLEDLRDATADQTDLLYARAKKEKTVFPYTSTPTDGKLMEKTAFRIVGNGENPLPA